MLSKMKTSVVVAALMLAVSAYANDTNVAASTRINVAAIQASLSDIPAVEIPVKASALMKAASKEAKLETAKAILKNVLAQRPQMAIQLVGALAKVSPESASQITTLALAIVPQYGDAIIKVASLSAPQFAAEIAVGASNAFPGSKNEIISWVSLAVPSQSVAVESAVNEDAIITEFIREYTSSLAQSGGGGNIASVKATLSNLIVESPVLRARLEEGLNTQQQEREAAQEAAALKAATENPGQEQTATIVKKKIVVTFTPGLGLTIREEVTEVQEVKIKRDVVDGVVQPPSTTTSTSAPTGNEEVTVIEVQPTQFPDPTDVEVQQGGQGSDITARQEEAEKQAALDLAEAVEQAYNQ